MTEWSLLEWWALRVELEEMPRKFLGYFFAAMSDKRLEFWGAGFYTDSCLRLRPLRLQE